MPTTAGSPALLNAQGGDAFLVRRLREAGAAAVGGYPTVSLPFGYMWGLPVGISFMGPRWSEPRLIALAYAFEQAAAARSGTASGTAAATGRPRISPRAPRPGWPKPSP